MSKTTCQNCGKGKMKGATSKHGRGVASKKFSKRAQKTKRILKPNLHTCRIIVKGVKKKMMFCAKCIKKLKKQASL